MKVVQAQFYTMQGERWGYETGYQDGYMEDR